MSKHLMNFSFPECYLLDLGLIKLLCRQNSADILYSEDGGSSRQYFVKGFVEELKASLAQNAKYAITNFLSNQIMLISLVVFD